MNKYNNIYSRCATIGSYGTICLPFAAIPACGVSVYTVVGRANDNETLYLSPVGQMEAGYAYIYKTEYPYARFLRLNKGEVKHPVEGQPLLGTFSFAPSLSRNARVLVGDVWYPALRGITIAANCACLMLANTPVETGGVAMKIVK